ncbi:hypothetical protein FG386_001154 [Cryptosporidium ryanae]|uniref:uncharacterized protein n=1 Tax=Cryptosporidium ryanae TaxID=515981 RepID=UPI00351A72DE|nr:hypothetical protein FG386_001154 [Cryptosporidium ryanae]
MSAKFCYKCKVNRASVDMRGLICYKCFSDLIEQNLRREIRIGAIERLKKLNKNHIEIKPPKSNFYVSIGFGFSSQVLLKLLSIIPNSGKRPDYQIKGFINVDTSCLVEKDPTDYYNQVRSFINKNFSDFLKDNLNSTRLHIIPFCSSFKNENNKNCEILRLKIIEIIKRHLSIGTDYIKLLIQLIIIRDIKTYLDEDLSQFKCLIMASTSDSIVSESFQYMTLSSGIHAKCLFKHLDHRWENENSSLFLIRPLRNISMKEIMLYWKYKTSDYLNCIIGAEISIRKSKIEYEIDKFVYTQNRKISNISNIFLKLNDTDMQNTKVISAAINNCRICGVKLLPDRSNLECIICSALTDSILYELKIHLYN